MSNPQQFTAVEMMLIISSLQLFYAEQTKAIEDSLIKNNHSCYSKTDKAMINDIQNTTLKAQQTYQYLHQQQSLRASEN
jgi:hypothetical protein